MGLMVIFPVYSHVFGGSLKIPLMIWWYIALTFVAVTFTKHFQVPKRYEHLYFCCMDTTLCKGVYPPPKYIGFRKPSIFRVPEILGEKACLQCYLHPTFLSCWGFGFRIYPHEDCQCSSPWVDFQSDILGESQHCLNFWRESIPVNMAIILDFFFQRDCSHQVVRSPVSLSWFQNQVRIDMFLFQISIQIFSSPEKQKALKHVSYGSFPCWLCLFILDIATCTLGQEITKHIHSNTTCAVQRKNK